MNIRKIISENPYAIFLKTFPTQINNSWKFAKYNARCHNSKDKNKNLTEILMLTHALEKAFSLPNPKKQFGIQKAIQLKNRITDYIGRYNWDESLSTPVSVLSQYVIYHENNNSLTSEIDSIKTQVQEMLDSHSMKQCVMDLGGTYDLTKEILQEAAKGDFKSLSANRYAIRNFDGSPVNHKLIHEALDIAKKSPSACNRQAYRVHIYTGEKKNKLLRLQGGANSFYETADSVLLISADANRYYLNEARLGYVDASLFAMTLIYAFSYLGIASIPLTLCIKQSVIKRINKEFDVPENEIPVLMIAIGNYPEHFSVAKSYRNPVEKFATTH